MSTHPKAYASRHVVAAIAATSPARRSILTPSPALTCGLTVRSATRPSPAAAAAATAGTVAATAGEATAAATAAEAAIAEATVAAMVAAATVAAVMAVVMAAVVEVDSSCATVPAMPFGPVSSPVSV